MVFAKSTYKQAVKDDKRRARRNARAEKKDARKDARAEKKDARRDKRATKKDARQDKRAEKKDARQDKRADLKVIRKSDLEGKEKRTAKKDVRQDKREQVRDARIEKKDKVSRAKRKSKAVIADANAEKKARVDAAKAKKKKRIAALKVPRAFDRKWASYLRFQKVDAVEIFKPKNLADLKSILKVARELELKVRAIGSGHSFSEVGVTDDFFVETKDFKRMLPISASARKRRFKAAYQKPKKSKLVEFEVGIEIFPLSKELEKLGLALGNQGTYDGQTFWGAVSTSTHGTGIGRPPFPDMVRSVVLVTEGGKTCRIEPTDGITKSRGWKEAGVDELIQNDDVFQSVVCSMGCMGIVYSAVIEARDMYWIEEWSYLTTWEDFKAEFSKGNKLREMLDRWEMVSLLVSPVAASTKEKKGVKLKGLHPCSIMIRGETKKRRKIGGTFHADIAKFVEKHHGMAIRRPHDSKTAPIPRVVKDPSRLAVQNFADNAWEGWAADQTSHAPDRRNRCYKIFPQGGKIFGGFASEFAFDVKDTFRVMDRIIELAKVSKKNGGKHSAPIAIRWVAPSSAYASPQYGRETVMFEVLMAKGTKRGKETVEAIERSLLSQEAEKGVRRKKCMRVHWGLQMGVMTGSKGQLERMYPKWKTWLATYARFNARGTFDNRFTDRLGISRTGKK